MVDGYPRASHRLQVSISDSPLEDGTTISDHAVGRPERLILEGEVSTLQQGVQGPAAAWAVLRGMADGNTLLDVQTEWGLYSSMLLERCSGEYRGRGLSFTLELRQVQIVPLGAASAPVPVADGPAANRTPTVARGRVGMADSVDTVLR